MKAQQYAEALYLATKGKGEVETDRVIENMVSTIRARHHDRVFPAVLHEFERIMRRRSSSVGATVSVIDQSDVVVFAEDIKKDLSALGASTLPLAVRIDPTQVGGYEVRACGQRIDHTYKRALVDMYHSLLTS